MVIPFQRAATQPCTAKIARSAL